MDAFTPSRISIEEIDGDALPEVAAAPPDGTAWTLDVEATEDGVALIVGFDLAGDWTTVRLAMPRPASRRFAQSVLAAGGDGTERTFPKPPRPEG